jgi:hypothetical protein
VNPPQASGRGASRFLNTTGFRPPPAEKPKKNETAKRLSLCLENLDLRAARSWLRRFRSIWISRLSGWVCRALFNRRTDGFLTAKTNLAGLYRLITLCQFSSFELK